jgi:hypothetical protein
LGWNGMGRDVSPTRMLILLIKKEVCPKLREMCQPRGSGEEGEEVVRAANKTAVARGGVGSGG